MVDTQAWIKGTMPFCRNSVPWLYVLEQNFVWDSGLAIAEDFAFKDKDGTVRLILEKGGRITVTRGYAWNGCSPKICLFDIVFGTPEGVVDSRTARPKTYYASLVHDALYQFVPVGIALTRAECDCCFLKLMHATGFRPRYLYYIVVWLFGWLTRPITHQVRHTVGSKFSL